MQHSVPRQAAFGSLCPVADRPECRFDIAIFRPGTAEWFVLRSEDASYYSFPFGASGDLPVPGDYDGDGKSDAAVFRPTTATWFLNRSSSGTLIQGFGASGDQPVPAAYVR